MPTTIHVGDTVTVIAECYVPYSTGVGPSTDGAWARNFSLLKDGTTVSSDNPYIDRNGQSWGYAESWQGTATAPGTWTFTAYANGGEVESLTITILPNTHTLTTSITGGSGTISPGPGSFALSGTQNVSVSASTDYRVGSFIVLQNGSQVYSTSGVTSAAYSPNMDSGDVSATVRFDKNQTTVDFSFSNTSKTYDGSALSVSVQPSDNNAVYSVSFDSGPSYSGLSGQRTLSGPTNAGSGGISVSVTGPDSSYLLGSVTGNSWNISRKSVTWSFGNLSNTYNGGSFTATATPSDGGAASGASYSLSYGPNAGGCTVSASANGNYTGSGSASAQISQKSVSFSFGDLANEYTGGSFNASVTPSDPTATFTQSVSYGPGVGDYTVSASATGNFSGSGSAQASVTSQPPSVSATISASPISTSAPGSASITWSSSNATSVTVTGPSFTTSHASSGTQTVSGLAAGTYVYTITAQGNDGPATQTASITITDAAPVVSATIAASVVAPTEPGSASIAWTSSNATSVSVSGPSFVTSVASAGNQTISGLAAGSYTYSITAQGNGGPVTKTVLVTIGSATPGDSDTSGGNVTAAISASPGSVAAPGAATITWSSSNATSVSVSGPNLTPSTAASGSQDVSGLAAGTYTYTITAQGGTGSVTKTATVTVKSTDAIEPVSGWISGSASANGVGKDADIQWSTTNATSVTVTGPSVNSTAASGAEKIFLSSPGVYTWTLTAQGAGGPVVRTYSTGVSSPPWLNSRTINLTASMDVVPWTGGRIQLSADTNIAGPGYVEVYETGTVWPVNFEGRNGQNVGFFDVPAVRTSYFSPTYTFVAHGTDSYGGQSNMVTVTQNESGYIGQDNVTISPAGATAGAGQTVVFTATSVMHATEFAWYDATASSGNTGELTIPANATVGSQYMIRVQSLAGHNDSFAWFGSGLARGVVTVTQQTSVLSWPTPAAITYGTPLDGAQLDAVANTPGHFNYTPGWGTVLPAGSRTLSATFTPTNTSSWTGGNVTVPLTVNPAPLVVTPDNQTRAYGAVNPPLTVTYRGFVNGDSAANLTTPPVISTSATTTSAVGAYPITASGGSASNYTISYANGTLTVTPKPVVFTCGGGSVPYDGSPKPITVTADDAFATYVIAYTGTGATLYGPSATAPSAAGTYTVVVTANGNYTGTATTSLTIAPAAPTLSWGPPSPVTYGTALGPTQLAATVVGNVPGTYAYTPSAGMVLDAGTHTLSVTFTPNDTKNYRVATGSVSLTVNKASLTVTASDATKLYGAANPSFGYTLSGFVHGDTAAVVSGAASLSTTATSSSPVGEYRITPALGTLSAANYSFGPLVPGSLAVTRAPLIITANNQTRTYGTSNPAFTLLFLGFVNGDTSSSITLPTIATAATAASPVGEYPITLSGGSAANYTLTLVNGTLTIGQKPVTFTFGGNLSPVYDGTPKPVTAAPSDPNATYAIAYAGTAGTVYGSSPGAPAAAGTYSVTATATGNYTGEGSATLAIAKATPLVSWSTPAPITYGTALSSTELNATATTAGTFGYSPTIGTILDAGTRTLSVAFTPTDAGNYNPANRSVSLTVNKASLAVVAASASRGYGASNPALTATLSGFVNGETASIVTGAPAVSTPATAASNVGSYAIVPTIGTLAAVNYSFGPFVNGTLTVTPAALTATAANQTRRYGAANPPLTITYSGFVNNDTSAVLSAPSISTTASAQSGVGTYPIMLTGGSAVNYTITRANGTMTVTPAPLVVTADDKTRVFGAANPALTYSFTGFVNGDTAATVSGSPLLSTAANASSNIGTYPIVTRLGTLGAANYAMTTSDGVLTVQPKPVTFTFEGLSSTYDGLTKSATVVPSDPAATYTADLSHGPAAGNYTVSVTATGNYSGTGSASATIIRAPVLFTFANLAHVYDGTAKTAQVKCSSADATYTTDLVKGPDAGNYTVSATATGDFVGSGTDTLVIAPAPQTITLNPTSRSVFAGQPAVLAAAGGANAYVWGGNAGASGGSGNVTLALATPGTYTVTVYNVASNNYQQSNTATATITVSSNHRVSSLTPIASSYTVHDSSSPLNGRTYQRLWDESGWNAYLGRSGVQFEVRAEAWPSVKSVVLEAKSPGGTWTTLASQDATTVDTVADATFSVMLGATAPGQPLVPLSYQQGSPQTGPWSFRARVQDANGEWSDYSSEVTVNVVLPIVTKTISGQTMPPAGPLGDWFNPSPIQSFSFPFWVP